MVSWFSELKNNDVVYIVYNKNYEHKEHDMFDYSTFYVIDTAQIIRNEKVTRLCIEYDSDDMITEHVFEIQTRFGKYYRSYDDFYNKCRFMTMMPSYGIFGPNINVFINIKDAKHYVCTKCHKQINYLNNQIAKQQAQIDLYKQSIKEAENYGK